MVEHTPTPWRHGTRATFRIHSGYDTIATVACDSGLRDQWEANAAFIVKAVNSHEALVKALEAAKAAMLRTRTASIAGCEDGYGKPGKWADELFASHGGLTASIKAIDVLLGGDVGGPRT